MAGSLACQTRGLQFESYNEFFIFLHSGFSDKEIEPDMITGVIRKEKILAASSTGKLGRCEMLL